MKKQNLSELLSNESFQQALEDLDWIHGENEHKAWEFVKLKQLEDQSVFLAIIIRSLDMTLRFNGYTYTRRGADLLERRSEKIKKLRKDNLMFKIIGVIKN